MKKTKLAIATLAAAVFAVGCAGALVACDKPDEPVTDGVTVTFNANGGTYAGGKTTVELTTDENGRIATKPADPTREDHTFSCYTLKADGTGDEVKFGASGTEFTVATTVYAKWTPNDPDDPDDPDNPDNPDDPVDPADEFTVTIEVGEGELDGDATTTFTTVGGKLAELPIPAAPDGKWFKGWYTEEGGYGTLVTADYEFTAEEGEDHTATLYARYIAEATITLDVGTDGTLDEGATTTFKTVNGKLDTASLPEPTTIDAAHIEFYAWYTTATAGVEVTDEYEFTADATIYARYLRANGLWIGDTFKAALVKNTGAALTGGLQAEYWLGGSTVTLNKDDVVSICMNGAVIPFYIDGSSAGINKTTTTSTVKSVTVTVGGPFAIYLKDYSTSSKPVNWTCEFAGPTEVQEGSEVPEGCDSIHWTFGTNELTFYIVDASGNPVGADDFSKFCLYAWTGGNQHFGDWSGCTTNGVLSSEMTSDVTTMPDAIIIRWGTGYGTQSANISGLVNGGVYLIELKPNSSGDSTVTKLELGGGEETPDPDPAPEDGGDEA